MTVTTTTETEKVTDYSRRGDIDAYLGQLQGEAFRRYRKEWRQAEKELRFFPYPLFLVVETVNTCNLSCAMCFRSRTPSPQPAMMSLDDYRRLIGEAGRLGCPSLSLNLNNEPLLDPLLVERVALAREAGFIDIRLNTNGILLTPEKSRALIAAGLTRLSVSIDAASEETYRRIRTGGDYRRLLNNLEAFIAIRDELQAALPVLRCTLVKIRENEHEVDAFINDWQQRADYVSIQSYVPHSNDDESMTLHPDQQAKSTDVTCSQPFERLVVTVDGNILPCCSPQGAEIILGRWGDTGLAKIWTGPQAMNLRRMMRGRCWHDHPVCSSCLNGTFDGHENQETALPEKETT